ncbi:MAG: zf-HC2 domain-containing protein [Blastocatellia bacterium]
MNCQQFLDQLSEYLEGELPSPQRAEFAAHRLCCPSCRTLHQEVRGVIDSLRRLAAEDFGDLGRESVAPVAPTRHPLSERILAATTVGEMVSCPGFDRLIEQYYDGVLLAPAHLALQDHFERCPGCRQMMHGIESAMSLCHEARRHPIELSNGWVDRMVAKTRALLPEIGSLCSVEAVDASAPVKRGWFPILSRDLAAALLMVAASTLLVLVRFGSLEGLASRAGMQAGHWVSQSQQPLAQLQHLSRQVSARLRRDLAPSAPPPSAKTGKE